MRHPFAQSITFILLAMLGCGAMANEGATVSKIKDGKALVNGIGREVQPGQYMMVLNASGELSGLVRVQAVKAGRAIVQISGGDVGEGARIVPYRAGMETTSAPESSTASADESPSSASSPSASSASTSTTSASGLGFFPDQPTRRSLWGASIQRLDQTMKVNFTAGSVEMKGENWAFGGFWEPAWSGPVRLRALAAITTTTLSGQASTASCAAGRFCEFSSMGMMMGGEMVYGFWENRHLRAYAAGGARAELPFSKSTNAVKEDGLTIAPSLSWGAGIEWRLGRDRVIPIGFTSLMSLQQAEGVEISGVGISAGYGTTF